MYNNIYYCIIDNVTYPVIEGLFSFNKRYVLLTSITKICNCKDKLKNYRDIIKRNSTEFGLGEHIVNIKDDIVGNDIILSKLLLRKSDIRASNFYILDDIGCRKLMDKVGCRFCLSDNILRFFDNDLALSKSSSEQLKYLFLKTKETNEIAKELENNKYIRLIKKSLVIPRKCKNAIGYRKNKIRPFYENYRKEALVFLLETLRVEDYESIQRVNSTSASQLLKKAYVLSDKLNDDYFDILVAVNKLRYEYLETVKNENIENLAQIVNDIIITND